MLRATSSDARLGASAASKVPTFSIRARARAIYHWLSTHARRLGAERSASTATAAVATRARMRDATGNWSVAMPDTSLHNCEQESAHQENGNMQVGFIGLGIMGASM